ncbi:lipoprotein [Psychroflexus planctonicus]|uniref:Type IV secretion system putative lipoprotein virB7 n=1 Tax=Psychroflexus planctonicus TaxID=1526575 RepID=A0ABQ1SCS6_9FLAO|nr:lipoprotein [Psychroflexus planctonicus]GGE28083.1 hypothetical protein GCM10010832_06010 [Psychroflexus planctonicus]
MKKITYLLVLLVVLSACNSAKRAQKNIAMGNYEQAIDIAIDHLQRDQTRNRGQEQILILQEAFNKIKLRDKKRIRFLEREKNASNSIEIYNTYQKLDRIQNRIQPLLPLYHEELGKNVEFEFTDYSTAILNAQDQLVDFYYNEAINLLNTREKFSARQAYEDLQKLESIRPNHKDTRNLIDEAYFLGTDFVMVNIQNQTGFVIPKQVQEALTDFNTYGLDDKWTQYHTNLEPDLDYDFEMLIDFINFGFSPDQLREKEIQLKDEVVDGWRYKTDARGNFVKDDEGNRIKEDVYVDVEGVLLQSIQRKSVAVEARVIFNDLKANQKINTIPLMSEFVFENSYAQFQGDARVLNDDEKRMLKNRPVPFPTNERMLIDASDDIKTQLKSIIQRNKIR